MYHCHSDYSLLDSATKYEDYVNLSVKNGSMALSISEHGKPLNWTEKWGACKKAGIKYIHSVEIYLTERLEPKVRDNYHTILIAKNMAGLLELNSIVSRSCDTDHTYYVNRISFDEFLGLSDNIITTSACLQSPLRKLPRTHPRYMELAKKYTFFEIQPHYSDDQIDFNADLLNLSKITGTPLIAGTDTHSSSQYKAECRKILMKSKGKSYGDEDSYDLTYKTYDELVSMFKKQGAIDEASYMAAIENTNVMADMVDEIELDTSIKYPILYGTREKDSEVFIETIKEKFEYKVKNGIIPKNQVQAFINAMDTEIEVFKKLKMMGFMLSMSELVSWCKDTGKAIGPARGSVGGSRIAYVTDVIDLNPETWHTVFSRFANEYREEIGDIDIDVIEEDRPEIFKYIVSRFGKDKTARVASFGTIQDKAAIDDIGRALARYWEEENGKEGENKWSLKKIARIKSEYNEDPESAKGKYPELFYYLDGLIGVKSSQSVHPAGMVISPITLYDNVGTFEKDGDICMFLDMDNVHDYTGMAKYDFLVLKTVQVIRDACNYIGVGYPKSHEVNWNDKNVWDSMTENPTAIFQMEGAYAFDCLKKFKPQSIFDMSIVTACIRPSGASYRDDLLARKQHKNPSDIIDNLLKDNLGYLIYQEDTIKFLQQICGLSGGASDNIRRAIGRKQKDRLDAALPSILDGYCSKSNKSREIAEAEAREFLQIIEDSASYQFGYNHSIAYCMLGYLCAYYRYYYPYEFITSFLNNAANDEDIINGTSYANKIGIHVTPPKFGVSKGEYFYDKDTKSISKGVSSIKYMGRDTGDKLYNLCRQKNYGYFVDLLNDISKNGILDKRQLDILIKIDFFSRLGNQRELFRISELFFDTFNCGDASKVKRSKVDGTFLEPIIKKYAVGTTKAGGEAKSYTLLDVMSILKEAEISIKEIGMSDLDDITKVNNFLDVMGYIGYTSGKEEDRPKLCILDIYPLKRKRDGVQFGYSFITKSIGSGKEARFTVFSSTFFDHPVKKHDIILCKKYNYENGYFTLLDYDQIF